MTSDNSAAVKKVIVFIDAENISANAYKSKYKKKIQKWAKDCCVDFKVRAYVVENGPSRNWESKGVTTIKIPGNPAKDKADHQIVKELLDLAGKKRGALLVTHDKGLMEEVRKNLGDTVELFGSR